MGTEAESPGVSGVSQAARDRRLKKATLKRSLLLRDIDSMKITEEVLTAYLHCKYKAYLLLTDVVREPSAYEQWLHRHQQEYTVAATRVLLDREEASCISSHTPLTSEYLQQGFATILGAHVEDASCAFAFHALQRVPGASFLGSFHYVPVLFCGTGPVASS